MFDHLDPDFEARPDVALPVVLRRGARLKRRIVATRAVAGVAAVAVAGTIAVTVRPGSSTGRVETANLENPIEPPSTAAEPRAILSTTTAPTSTSTTTASRTGSTSASRPTAPPRAIIPSTPDPSTAVPPNLQPFAVAFNGGVVGFLPLQGPVVMTPGRSATIHLFLRNTNEASVSVDLEGAEVKLTLVDAGSTTTQSVVLETLHGIKTLSPQGTIAFPVSITPADLGPFASILAANKTSVNAVVAVHQVSMPTRTETNAIAEGFSISAPSQ